MKVKVIKVLGVSALLSLTMGCVALTNSGTKQNNSS